MNKKLLNTLKKLDNKDINHESKYILETKSILNQIREGTASNEQIEMILSGLDFLNSGNLTEKEKRETSIILTYYFYYRKMTYEQFVDKFKLVNIITDKRNGTYLLSNIIFGIEAIDLDRNNRPYDQVRKG